MYDKFGLGRRRQRVGVLLFVVALLVALLVVLLGQRWQFSSTPCLLHLKSPGLLCGVLGLETITARATARVFPIDTHFLAGILAPTDFALFGRD